MIKRFFYSFLLLTGMYLAAAENAAPSPAAFYGDFASALEISSAVVRQTTLLKLLAASSADASQNLTAYRLLQAEFAEKEPGKTVLDHLAQLYKEHPADLMIVSLYAEHGDVENMRVLLERALAEIVPPAPQDKRFACYLQLVENAMESIIAEDDPLENAWQEKFFEARLALLDRVIAKQKTAQFALIHLKLDLIRKALYFCDDLLPEQKQFKELPADHRRKKLYEETLAQWKTFLFARERETFLKQFEMANALDLPECDRFSAEAVRRYGVMAEEIRELITQAAVNRKNYDLYRPCSGGEPVADTVVAVYCEDFKAAKQTAKSPFLQRYVAVSKAVKAKDRAAITCILNALPSQMPLTSMEYQALLLMAEVTHDAVLYRQLRQMLLAQTKPEELKTDLANSLGCVAVMLNTDLKMAEKLLERVYGEESSSAYTDSLAMLRLRQGRYDEAAKLIREAFSSREPGEAASVFLLHAAQIMTAKGDKALARKLLTRAKRCVRPGDFEYDAEVEKKLTEELK